MKKNWKKLSLLAVVLLVFLGVYLYTSSREAAKEARANSFHDTTIARGDVLVTIRATGTVAPENRLEIKPAIAGRIESVLIHEGQLVRRNQILAWTSSTERAAVLDAARSKGPEEVKRWEELYLATPILSPINGTVILRSVEQGQTFSATDSILVLSDRLTVKAQVDETDLAQVKVGSSAVVTLDAYPNDPIPAKVSRVAFEATTVSNVTMYIVYVVPEKTPEVMRSGMTSTVRFDVASKKDVLVVPNDALKAGADGETTVLLKDESGIRTKTPIKLGLTDGKYTEVVEGLKEGDVVSSRALSAQAMEKATNPFMPGAPKPTRKASSGGKTGGGPPP